MSGSPPSDLPRGPRKSSGDTPSVLDDWIRRHARVEPTGDQGSLLEGAVRALDRSISFGTRDREAAYALLASDALLTRICGDAAGADDPEARLLEIQRRLRREPAT